MKPDPMIIVRAGARNDIDRADAGRAGRGVEVEGRELELLNRLLREVLRRPASDSIVDRRPVYGDARHRLRSAGH